MPQLNLPPERKIRRYGFRRSLGRIDEPVANTGGLTVAPEVDPRDVFAPLIENQWALGSCTSNADENNFRYDGIQDGTDPGQLCRLQIYWGERKIEGTLGKGDTGAEGHDGFTVAQSGIVAESVWPYDWPDMTADKPPADSVFDPPELPQAVVDAQPAYTLTRQVAVVPQNLTAIKQVLTNHQTISLGFTVYESFESPELAQTGIMPMPQPGEQVLGGHEVLVVGYLKSEPHYVLVANSWGGSKSQTPNGQGQWGLNGEGFFLMPVAFLLSPNVVTDLRTIVRPLA